jgi:hypothetical protein
VWVGDARPHQLAPSVSGLQQVEFISTTTVQQVHRSSRPSAASARPGTTSRPSVAYTSWHHKPTKCSVHVLAPQAELLQQPASYSTATAAWTFRLNRHILATEQCDQKTRLRQGVRVLLRSLPVAPSCDWLCLPARSTDKPCSSCAFSAPLGVYQCGCLHHFPDWPPLAFSAL